MIRVCLVEDQTLVREGLRSLLALAPDIAVVAEASDGVQALSIVPAARPDLVLLDLRLPGLSGLEVLRRLRQEGRLPPTIILTTFDDPELILQGLDAGARGYLLKDVTLERLVEAIRTVAAGGRLVAPAADPRVERAVASEPAKFETLEPPDPLTGREVEVLRMLSGGYSNKEIARALRLAEGTVKNHVSSILSKLGVRDRTRAVLVGIRRGLLA
jgi:DNA-binding NarL/FixJ family response regulator